MEVDKTVYVTVLWRCKSEKYFIVHALHTYTRDLNFLQAFITTTVNNPGPHYAEDAETAAHAGKGEQKGRMFT